MKGTSLLASLLVLGLLLGVIKVNIGTANPEAVISVEPKNVTAKVGETFTVDFMVADVSDCYTWQIFAQFDKTIIDYVRWWEGPFLKGNPALTLQSYAYYNDTDSLDLPGGPPNWGKLFDKNLDTYSDFQYSETDGYYGIYKFGIDPVGTVSTIKKVDLTMKYNASASTLGDMYRIVYHTGTPSSPGAKTVLVGWTSAATPLDTYVWEDLAAPTADGWQWTEDVDGLSFTVETDRVGGDTGAEFWWYEAWLTITYERPRNPGTDIKTTGVLFGLTGQGAYPGVSGSGLLATMEFIVKSEADETIDIQGVIGSLVLTYLLDPSADDIECTKENGYFFVPWPEDVYPDGIIDIRDLAIVGVNYGKTQGEPAVFAKSPTSWTDTGAPWTYPERAASSDDSYADVPKNGIEIYSGYGFVTVNWASVTKVEIGVEGYSEGGEIIRIDVSWDGGSSWTSTHDVTLTASDTLTWVDVTSDHSWTPDELSDANFRVRGEGVAVGGYKATYVDWLPVKVNIIGPITGDIDGDGDVDITDLSMVAVKYGSIYL